MPEAPRSYALADLPWTAVAAHLAGDRRLIVPVGACGQYGPHLPLAAATAVAEALADDLSREFGVLRAPSFRYGVNSPAERDHPGSATLKAKTLHRGLNELLSAWSCQGFDEFVVLTADLYFEHGEAIATLRASGARVRVVEALKVDLSQFTDGRTGPEHGGEVLTSLLLHLRPGAVCMDEARDYLPHPAWEHLFARGRLRRFPEDCPGSIGRPTLATAEKGASMYEHILQKVRHKVFIAPPPEPKGE
jgi:creatinine amidohydrolase/Fe(II)-dependent formamide hydrolase-like protein